MTHLFVDTGAVTAAHEFGHMLGLFDEYLGGAVDKVPNPTLTNTGLMGLGAINPNPEMLPRYYQQFLDFANSNDVNPSGDRLEMVSPLPSSLAMVAFTAVPFALIVLRRRHPHRTQAA